MLWNEPKEWEVIDFDAGLWGGDLNFQHCVWRLFRNDVLEELGEDGKVICIWDSVHAEGECPPARLNSSDADAPLGITQTTVDLVKDDVLLPGEGRRLVYGDRLVGSVLGGELLLVLVICL